MLAVEQSSRPTCLYSFRQIRQIIGGRRGANCMADQRQSERGDIQRLVTESERHVRVLAAVAVTMLPHHTVEMSRDNNGVLGLQLPVGFNVNTCSEACAPKKILVSLRLSSPTNRKNTSEYTSQAKLQRTRLRSSPFPKFLDMEMPGKHFSRSDGSSKV